jgi:hypothetical protein
VTGVSLHRDVTGAGQNEGPDLGARAPDIDGGVRVLDALKVAPDELVAKCEESFA